MTTLIHLDNADLPGLNVLLNMNKFARQDEKRRLKFKIGAQTKNKHAYLVSITVTRYAIQLMDWDNFAGGFKLIGDALKENKIILDDKPQIVVDFIPKQVKLKSKAEKSRVIVIIQDIH